MKPATCYWVMVSNIFGIFTPKIGEDEPILRRAYFSVGMVQPPTWRHWHLHPHFPPDSPCFTPNKIGSSRIFTGEKMVKQPAKLWNSPVSRAITLDRIPCCFQIHIPTIAPPPKKRGPTKKTACKNHPWKTGSVLIFLGGILFLLKSTQQKCPSK